jgi:hypothetical protein
MTSLAFDFSGLEDQGASADVQETLDSETDEVRPKRGLVAGGYKGAGRVFWNTVGDRCLSRTFPAAFLHIHSEIAHEARVLSPLRRTESLDCTILT